MAVKNWLGNKKRKKKKVFGWWLMEDLENNVNMMNIFSFKEGKTIALQSLRKMAAASSAKMYPSKTWGERSGRT